MSRLAIRSAVLLAMFLATGATASAQINWSVTYSDPTSRPGFGFDDNTPAGSTTVGQLRRDSVTAATNYLSSVLDGRGTLPITWNQSLDTPPGQSGFTAGQFRRGTSAGYDTSGYFFGGQMYQLARSGTHWSGEGTQAGSGQINFNSGVNWHYDVPGTTTSLNPGTADLVTVLVHEITHGLAFTSGVTNPSTGRGGNRQGDPSFVIGTSQDWYTTYDLYMQRGNGPYNASSALFRTDVTQTNYATFNTSTPGLASTFTGGNENPDGTHPNNNQTSGLYFGGPYTREVFGGPVPLFSPATFVQGSSIAHDNVADPNPTGLMNWFTPGGTSRRLQPYEIGMLLDMGWNVYDWKTTSPNNSGNWLDGVSNLPNSNWRTDRGIVLGSDGSSEYNTPSDITLGKAPVLPPYGQVTSNIVLNFGGTTTYTSTNDIGTIRVARLNFNNTAAVTISGGNLNFGQNLDGTASVLAPKIVQQGGGAVTISSGIQTNSVATQTVGGVTFPGWSGLTVDGTGGGQVTLSGPISGTGSLTKAGAFTLVLGSTIGNSYSGGTTLSAGTLLVNGQPNTATGTGSGPVTANAGVLGGNGRIAGLVTVNNGATLAPGITATPTSTAVLTLGNGVTFASGATFQVQLNGATAGSGYDRLDVTGAVNLNGATLTRTLGYSPNILSDRLFIIVNDDPNGVADPVNGTFNGLANGAQFTIGSTTAYIYYDGDFGTNSLGGGNDVVISFSPIPEPATVLGIAAAVLSLGAGVRRLRRRPAEGETALAP